MQQEAVRALATQATVAIAEGSSEAQEVWFNSPSMDQVRPEVIGSLPGAPLVHQSSPEVCLLYGFFIGAIGSPSVQERTSLNMYSPGPITTLLNLKSPGIASIFRGKIRAFGGQEGS